MIKVGTLLDCGCCGLGFKTWVGYTDQDQDRGYGICQSCQGWIDELEYQKIDKVVRVLDVRWAEGTKNHEIWSNYSQDDKRQFVLHQIDRGAITWEFQNGD